MRPTRALPLILTLLFVVTSAFAQRGHGPVGGSSGAGGTDFSTMNGMGGMSLLVAPDGTVLSVATTLNTTSNLYTPSVVAVGPSGTVAWRWPAPSGVHRLGLAGNLVLVASGTMGGYGSTPTISSELSALSLSNGSVAWRVGLPGIVVALETSVSTIYALVMDEQQYGAGSGMGGMGGGHYGPPGSGTGTGMTGGKRTLVAVSTSGVILWKLPLD